MAFRGIPLSGVAYPRSRETRRTLNNKTGRKRAFFFEIAHQRKVKQNVFHHAMEAGTDNNNNILERY